CVLRQEGYKKQSRRALIPITKRVGFDNEVKKVGCFMLDGWIQFISTKGLVNIAQYPFECFIPIITKRLRSFALAYQLLFKRSNSPARALISQLKRRSRTLPHLLKLAIIVLL